MLLCSFDYIRAQGQFTHCRIHNLRLFVRFTVASISQAFFFIQLIYSMMTTRLFLEIWANKFPLFTFIAIPQIRLIRSHTYSICKISYCVVACRSHSHSHSHSTESNKFNSSFLTLFVCRFIRALEQK